MLRKTNTFLPIVLLAAILLSTYFVGVEVAEADGAYRWKDSAGNEHFGSNPPKDAIDLEPLRGRSFSRYSSEKLLKPYSRMSLSTESLEKKLEQNKNGDRKVDHSPEAAMPPQPELPNIGEQDLVSSLQQGEVKVSHDEKNRVTACQVKVKNTSSLAVNNVIVAFQFNDGSLVPGVGPTTVDGNAEVTFEIPADLLPMTIQGAEGEELPQPKVTIQAGNG